MKKTLKKKPRVDWSVIGSAIFLVGVIIAFAAVITFVPPKLPQPLLHITQTSASANNLIITHQGGDTIRFANTKCIWTPDISAPDVTEEGGALVLNGPESSVIAKFEPGEVAKLEKDINITEGKVGKLVIIDLKSDQQIFSQTVNVTK
ncbi:MAG: hypothetical protein WBD09_01215 [Halobacteriota archaeon]